MLRVGGGVPFLDDVMCLAQTIFFQAATGAGWASHPSSRCLSLAPSMPHLYADVAAMPQVWMICVFGQQSSGQTACGHQILNSTKRAQPGCPLRKVDFSQILFAQSEACQDRTFLSCLPPANAGFPTVLLWMWTRSVHLHEDIAGQP